MREVIFTHECSLGIMATFCLEDRDSICQPGLGFGMNDIRVPGCGCIVCPRNPEVPMIPKLEPDRKFYHTKEMYNDAFRRYRAGEVVKMKEISKSN